MTVLIHQQLLFLHGNIKGDLNKFFFLLCISGFSKLSHIICIIRKIFKMCTFVYYCSTNGRDEEGLESSFGYFKMSISREFSCDTGG